MKEQCIRETIAQKLNRRRFMRGSFGGAALAGLVLAGCSSDNNRKNNTAAAKATATKATNAAATVASGGATAAAVRSAAGSAAATGPPAAVAGAPAFLKGTKLSFLGGTYYIPEGEATFKQILSDWGRQSGVETSYEANDWPSLQPRIAANIQAGNGPDLMGFFWFWPSLYADNLVDLSDIAGELESRWGGFTDAAKAAAYVKGQYLGVPLGAPTNAFNYRMSYLKKAGYGTFPDTWDDFFRAGAALKQQAKPIGVSLGRSLGDPLAVIYPYMYSYGATEVQEDGKTPGFQTPEFTDALQKWVQGWKDGMDETGLSWDDSSNNKAFLADQLAITNNGSSIYLAALKDQPAIARDMNHAINPRGPTGRFSTFQTQEFAILNYSKNQAAAKEFLKYFFSDAVYTKWFQSQKGYHVPPTRGKFLDDAVFTGDPKLRAFIDQAKLLRLPGYAAQPGPAAAGSMANYIIVDMFARAVQTGNVKQAISDAADQIKKTYSA
ncbi:MAG: ABC transporter substrate-binding protein [Dehalococcoidia bacterium]